MELTKVDRARMLRRMRKPALASMEYGSIAEELAGISEACEDIHYFMDGEGTLLDALDGDDEAEYEFRMAFSVLDEKVNALQSALDGEEWAKPFDEEFDPEADFNSCLVALVGDYYLSNGGSIWGYDAGVGDYFTLDDWDGKWATSEAGKRLCRKTKPQMLHSIQVTLRIFLAMVDIREEYDYLRCAFDILGDENRALLRTIKDIEEAYDKAEEISSGFWYLDYAEVKYLDRLVATLPERCWVE